MTPVILVLNAGSSSVKFSVFHVAGEELHRLFRGEIEGLGAAPHLSVKDEAGTAVADQRFDSSEVATQEEAVHRVLGWLHGHSEGLDLMAVGHRVVHGGPAYAAPVLADPDVLNVLAGFEPLAPSHQPHNLAPIRELLRARPDLPQVACFDTAFHRTAPLVAQLFGLPHELFDAGVRRYGFHGLSYDYIVQALGELDPAAAAGRLVVAHLGNGCSMAAVRDRRSLASTMGFTALDGLPMGTRCGQIDPGVLLYLMQARGMTANQVEHLLYKQAGLKGLSGISNDMRDLMASEQPGAKVAIDYFVYRIGRELGSLAAALGGLDALVFTAGIGEHAAGIRARVCRDAAWLQVTLDEDANRRGGPRISPAGQVPSVWVIPTDEELMIACHTASLLHSPIAPPVQCPGPGRPSPALRQFTAPWPERRSERLEELPGRLRLPT
jgi:acetate kinase